VFFFTFTQDKFIPMNIYQLFQYINYLLRKDPIGNTFNGEQANIILPIVAFKYFKKIFGLPEEYEKGMERARLGFGLNSITENKLRPLKVKVTDATLVSGEYTLPSNYYRDSDCYLNPSAGVYYPVPILNDQEFNDRLSNPIDSPSVTDPIAKLLATTLLFNPTTVTKVVFEYIKYPTSPVLGYAIDNDSKELTYVPRGAYVRITGDGAAGDTINIQVAAATIGNYTVIEGDNEEDIMVALKDSINDSYETYGYKAVYDGTKIVIIDAATHTTVTVNVVGTITYQKTDFSVWSTQFDWQTDLESMDDIAEIICSIVGISNRDVNVIQWSEQQKVTS